jgi:replication factor C subunit 3/5
MEQYTRNTRFCLICNYVNKIIPALQSRCMRFRFAPLKKAQVVEKIGITTLLVIAVLIIVAEVAKKEDVRCDADGLDAIFRLSNGDMRKCLNILQSTNMSFGSISEVSQRFDLVTL